MLNENKKIPISPNSCWNFKIDKVYNYVYLDNFFTPEECKKIIEIGEKRILIKAEINNEKNFTEVRNSSIAWLFPMDDMQWAFMRLSDAIVSLNNTYFNFDLFGFSEGLQFTKYDSPSGFYGPHIDKSFNQVVRKLSITIQLSAPEEYEGGELSLIFEKKPDLMQKQQGKLIVFPSYVLHEVLPVTKGTRYSLVSWITGKPFK
jgi:PKHD-type hydroxylase